MVDTAGRLKAIREYRQELSKLSAALVHYEGLVNAGWNEKNALSQTKIMRGWMMSTVETHLRLLNLSLSNEDFFQAKMEFFDFAKTLPQRSFPHVVTRSFDGKRVN